jgi:F-type H+-transporting ATPase subunit b
MDNMIDLDVTIFIQLINFLIAIVALNFLLIKPVRQQIAERGAITANLAGAIEKFSAEASDKLSNYEASLAEARSQAALARDAIKAEGGAREQQLLQSAQAEAQAFLQSSRDETAKEAKAATDALISQVNTFAQQAMKKILG